MKPVLFNNTVKNLLTVRLTNKLTLCRCCSGINKWNEDLSVAIKHDIESHWKDKINVYDFDDRERTKFYVLSMFPYPSGNLHMGHVRVYTISDTIARFHHMNGKRVIHPMGWDAFGLPAENAAMERDVAPSVWTRENIANMKGQLKRLGCNFDWSREVTTCDPEYYKWTQYLFLKMYRAGLVYRKFSLVNWDPVDQTVLADEQVDKNGCSWRSGAKVERKLLKQWFVRTTRFAKALSDGLSDPILQDWKDIIKLQKHWIGECNGVVFELQLNTDENLTVWTRYPEHLMNACFVAVSPANFLAKMYGKTGEGTEKLKVNATNVLDGRTLPVYVTDSIEYEPGTDSHLGIPAVDERDKVFALENRIPMCEPLDRLDSDVKVLKRQREICEKARKLNIGGYWTSSKLRDWLISRQRYWGTPIPVVHCTRCGVQPVDESELPIRLPELERTSLKGSSHLEHMTDWLHTKCPECGAEAKRETDTMDTFVDSAWYYLRYIDPKNDDEPFSKKEVMKLAPVDLYVGGKEHAVLHLYYARFINHFLHSCDLVPEREPFKRLLVQGMVMGRSYRLKSTGKYIPESQVEKVDLKKRTALDSETKQPVIVSWEKMSKSKLNGVDPGTMFEEYGADTSRLLILADVAPTSHRNWTSDTFPGILNWQRRLWLTVQEFIQHRTNLPSVDFASEEFRKQENYLYDSRNYYVKGVTFNYSVSQQLSVAISKMQGLTNSLRRTTPDVVAFGKQYERALSTLLIMLAPMAPHFTSELWSGFVSAPNSLNVATREISWKRPVFDQKWPDVDFDYECDLQFKVNGAENSVCKIPRIDLDKLTRLAAFDLAMNQPEVLTCVGRRRIANVDFKLYKGCTAIMQIFTSKEKIASDNS